MRKYTQTQKFWALVLTLVMVIGLLPKFTLPVTAAAADVLGAAVTVADPGTSAEWEAIMGTDADGSRYAGRVWVDKSVYTDGDTAVLNKQGGVDPTLDPSFTVDVDKANGEYFQVIFSALGSSMSSDTTVSSTKPLDVVLVLDTSTSMDDTDSNRVTRMERMIVAANDLLKDLTALSNIRIAIVSYNADSETIIDLANYNNGINLSVNIYTNTNGGGVITAKDNAGNTLGKDDGYHSGTNLQAGIDRGFDILADATGTDGRAPIAIVLTDGRANRAVNSNWHTLSSGTVRSSGDAGILLSTLLNAAYNKTRVEKNYGTDMTVYGVGIDLSSSSGDYIYLNPSASNGFNASNSDSDVRKAWQGFTTWRNGSTASVSSGSRTWTFDHNWPASAGVTTAEIADNIYYVDNYQDVSGADLGDAFDKIVDELKQGAFNPITSKKEAASGVENTPLIYADNIGKYMEVRNIQALQVFGQTFNVTKNADGTYSVAAGTGVNPTTGENWSAADDVRIEVRDNTDGTQQLRIYIDQEILPILLDKITSKTEDGVTTSTLEVTEYAPLRVYYTVGIDSDILLSDGTVDPTKLESGYSVDEYGNTSFYANAFARNNLDDLDGDGMVELGDAHVGFVPSHNNRFYYHQTHQEIFISATNLDGTPIVWEEGEYGVRWDPAKYQVKAMNYADYAAISDDTQVYTYVTFTRPTGSGNAAEEVTYLVYTTWGDLKSAVTFYDKGNDVAVNGGSAIEPNDKDSVNSVVAAYKQGKSIADTDLIAVLGLQSRRVSRLHNMFEYKSANETETAELAYAPAYSSSAHEEGDIHEHSEVIVWLGNNGKVSLPVATGIQVTKEVAEFAQGDDEKTEFEVQVLLDMAYSADAASKLLVTDADGKTLGHTATDEGGKLMVTVKLADSKTARILGLPKDTAYTVTEVTDKYSYTYTGATRTVAGKLVEGTITNEELKPGGLYITKTVENVFAGYAFPTNEEFVFEVTFLDKNGAPIANKEFKLENNYDPAITARSTDENGVMIGWLRHGETVYIKDIPAGAQVTVEEVSIPTAYTATKYSSIDFSGDTADADGEVIIVSEKNATVEVTNTYTPDKVNVDISFSGTKNFDATNMSEDATFTFKLQKHNGTAWEDVEGEVITITKGTNAQAPFVFDPLHLEYAEPGVHSYQIIEVKGENTDITYDRSVYTFSVNVTVDGNGDLQAEVVGYNEIENVFDVSGDSEAGYQVKTVFTNQYHTTATSVAIEKKVDDLAGTGKTSANFVIESYEASVDGDVWTIGDLIRTTTTDALGEAMLVRNYDNTDFETNDTDGDNQVTYYFIIKEKTNTNDGWKYDATQYQLRVVLTKDPGTGVITAEFDVWKVAADGTKTDLEVSGNTATIQFANIYDPADAVVPVDTSALVRKSVEGRALVAGEFTFVMFEDGKVAFDAEGNPVDPVAVATNDADGNVYFGTGGKLTFSQVGKYEYDIVEVKGSQGGMTYDETIYDLVVDVTDNGDGTLKANYYFLDSVSQQVTFKNTYTVAPTEVVIEGHKHLTVESGERSIHAGEFAFELYQGDVKIADTKNLAGGAFRFEAIKYGQADIGKTYTYTVKEVKGTLPGITYTDKVFTVTVTVTDNGDGTITAAASVVDGGPIHFTNIYNSKPVSVTLPGQKNLQDRTLTAGEFKFALYQTNLNFEGLALLDDTITHDADGKFTVDLGTLGMGEHYFVVKEVIPEPAAPGIHYSGAQYNITVNVTDAGNGQMAYTTSVVNAGTGEASQIVFDNLYRPESGTLVIDGSKVLNAGPTAADGTKKVAEGQFSFELYDSEGTLLQTAQVKADGTFEFEPLTFSADDIGRDIAYTVKEVKGDDAKIDYDGTEFTVQVVVKDDNKDGVLEITKTVKKGSTESALTFTNTYHPTSITHVIEAEKSYTKELKGGEFTFELSGDTIAKQTVKNAAGGKVTFDPVSFDHAGEYTFLVKEVEKTLGFVTYSEAEYEVTVKVVNTEGVLSIESVTSKKIKGAEGENDLTFVNEYKYLDEEDEITVSGVKTLTGFRSQPKAGEFTFGLYKGDKLVEQVTNAADGSFTFTTLKYGVSDIGTHTYTVKEIIPEGAVEGKLNGYTYDATVYTVTVTVIDDNQGNIKASAEITGAEAIVFANKYEVKPAEVTLKGTKVYEKGLEGDDFTFTLEGEIDGVKVKQEKKNDADGNILFDKLTFTKEGTYEFSVKETDQILGFINYSKEVYEVVVKVTDNGKGQLVYELTVNDKSNGEITFENVYQYIDAEDEVTVSGTKKLTGFRSQPKAGEFTFGLYKGDKLVEQVTNAADGSFTFTTLKYGVSDIGTHIYTVKEIIPEGAVENKLNGYTYDATVYTVTVTVIDDNQGNIKASAEITGAEAIAFANKYEVKPAEVTLKGTKTYDKPLNGDDFTFLLEGQIGDTKIKQEKKNAKDGSITFDKLTFTAEGKYDFTVKEQAEALGFIQYAKEVYKVTVTVTDNGKGELAAAVTVDGKADGKMEFVNDYTLVDGDNELTLSGTKALVGRDLAAGEFSFGLYDDSGKLLETVTNDAAGKFTFSKLTYQVKENESATYTYTVKEIAGTDPSVTYDKTVYTVIVNVADDNKGGTQLNYTVNGAADGTIAFTNVYTQPKDVVAKIYIQKNVVNKTEPGIGLKDFTFVMTHGDAAVEVKSDENGKAGFQVTFGAEDIGKTFEFKVSEKKGNTAGMTYDTTVHTVTVKVSQNADGSLALTINDKATDSVSLTFTNTYEKPGTPVTGDNFPLMLVGMLMLLSAAAIALLLSKGKKRGKYAA